jgi:hypothetical protein
MRQAACASTPDAREMNLDREKYMDDSPANNFKHAFVCPLCLTVVIAAVARRC